MSKSRFLSNGHGRASKGLQPQIESLRSSLWQKIEEQYAPQLSLAGFLERSVIKARMKLEFRRRLAQAVGQLKKAAPPHALYLKK
jgi:hypothetical protein